MIFILASLQMLKVLSGSGSALQNQMPLAWGISSSTMCLKVSWFTFLFVYSPFLVAHTAIRTVFQSLVSSCSFLLCWEIMWLICFYYRSCAFLLTIYFMVWSPLVLFKFFLHYFHPLLPRKEPSLNLAFIFIFFPQPSFFAILSLPHHLVAGL